MNVVKLASSIIYDIVENVCSALIPPSLKEGFFEFCIVYGVPVDLGGTFAGFVLKIEF